MGGGRPVGLGLQFKFVLLDVLLAFRCRGIPQGKQTGSSACLTRTVQMCCSLRTHVLASRGPDICRVPLAFDALSKCTRFVALMSQGLFVLYSPVLASAFCHVEGQCFKRATLDSKTVGSTVNTTMFAQVMRSPCRGCRALARGIIFC